MRTKKLLLLGMLFSTTAINAQVVYGYNEKDYVKGICEVATTRCAVQSSGITETHPKFHLSGIGDNWFVSVKGGAAAYLGHPKGCGDLSDKTQGTMLFSLGKWHSRFFGTRFVYQGFKAKGVENCFNYHNLHGDLLLNVSSFFRYRYDPMPKWDVLPYLGFGGIIRTGDLHRHPFALSYGVVVSYRATQRLHVSAELGATSTSQDFDGIGKQHHFGDNLLSASIGLSVGIGRQGYDKKETNYQYLPLDTVTHLSDHVRNDYSGLKSLRERMLHGDSIEVDGNMIKFSAPILFFFKINTTKLIDRQQLVNISEIASAVKEYGLKVKVAGAADSKTGTKKFNRELSIKRCKYIAKLLLKAGVPKESMSGVSEGGVDWYRPYTANRHTCVILYKER